MKVLSSINLAVRTAPAAFCVFDALLVDHDDLRRLPLRNRRDQLGRLVQQAPGLQIVSSIEEHGIPLFEQACELDMERIVGKDLTATYRAGMQPTWVKIKESELFAPGGAWLSQVVCDSFCAAF